MRGIGVFLLAAAAMSAATAARADLVICNDTAEIQSVSIGYKGDDDWTSEGWWNIDPGACSTVIAGDLKKRYYYYRAEVDGGAFEGENYMFCTTPEEYTIVGDADCEDRGYDRENFSEIDTGETAKTFTYRITQATAAPSGGDETLGLEFCNQTDREQSVSVAYEGDEGFTSEGWWNVQPGSCATPLPGALSKHYYYYRTETLGEPSIGGSFNFCTSPEAYTIVGEKNCEARGYDSEGFAEIDTGPTAKQFTVNMTQDLLSGDSAAPPAPTPQPAPAVDGAGLRICNETQQTQSLAIGYEGAEDWTSEGWWNVAPGDCVAPKLDGVNRRYFYYRAEVDGGAFTGQNYFFCTSPQAFTIVGDTNCEARGHDREDFWEIDTGGTTGSFTFTLVRDEDLPMIGSGQSQESTAEPDASPGPAPEATPVPVPDFDFGDDAGEVVATDPEPEPEAEPEPEPEPEYEPDPVEEPQAPTRRGGSRG